MNRVVDSIEQHAASSTALERGFPIVEVSKVAEQESWRKEINRPIYHIHKWWATRLGSVFRAITLGALSRGQADYWPGFYRRHAFLGKVVLDPFMGSGTTLGEALKLGAKAVGCDINPISTFQVRQAFTRVSEAELRSAFGFLERTVAADIRRYYQTTHPVTGETIPVLYFFWTKTVETPEGEIIPLLSRYVFAQNAYPKKRPRSQILCSTCWAVFADRYDATCVQCPACGTRFNPQEGPAAGQYVTARGGRQYKIKDLVPRDGRPLNHRMYALLALQPDGHKIYLPAREEDLALYARAERRLTEASLPLPIMAVRPGHNTDQARGYNFLNWRDFFNTRQLLCLGLLFKAILQISDRAVQQQMLCLFSSTLEFNNMFCSFKGEGTGAVRHMFSHHILKPERTPLENSVWGTDKSSGTFSTLFESRLLRAKKYMDEPFEVDIRKDLFGELVGSGKVTVSTPMRPVLAQSWQALSDTDGGLLILNGDSSRLPLPDECIDTVVTDPPYFDFVHYSELSDYFFAWLAPALKSRYRWFDRKDSSAPGEVQHRDPRVFAKQLAAVFAECRRVLKEQGVLVFSFHHSRPEGWAAIYEAITQAGFTIVAAHPVHAELRAASPKSAAKNPISIDAILVCRKRLHSIRCKPDLSTIPEKAEAFANKLGDGGIALSTADRFVIRAALTLVGLADSEFSFESVRDLLAQSNTDQDFGVARGVSQVA